MLPRIHDNILRDWVVLVVEDDPNSMDVADIILSFHGARVVKATNGKEGLELAYKVNPRFIISDISMPGMDGWSMIEMLKGDPRTANIPVIALSAHAMQGYRERAMAAGFHNYITKPLTPDTFIKDLVTLLINVPEFAAEFAG
jgi:two-component system, cell cycle response regulator DivK